MTRKQMRQTSMLNYLSLTIFSYFDEFSDKLNSHETLLGDFG